MADARGSVALAITIVGGAVSAALAWATGRSVFLDDRWRPLVLMALWCTVAVPLVLAVVRLPRRWSIGVALGLGLMLRVLCLSSGTLSLSDDAYRYVWDGRVQAAGIDPYRSSPDDPSLRALREPTLWPDDAGCHAIGRDPGCTRLNRPAVRTIYPPVAEAWFRAVYAVGGVEGGTGTFQGAAALVDVALIALLAYALRALGTDPRWAAAYALCPFPIVELAGNAHVDGLAALALVGGVLVVARRPVVGGLLVALAALVKLYPALVLAALWRRRGWWRAVAVAGIVSVLAYLPHVLAVGVKVLGYLPGYLQEEHYDGGGRFLLAGSVPGPSWLTTGLAAAALLGALAWIGWRRPPVEVAAAQAMGALLLVTTPVQPWYAVTLLALATLARSWRWFAVAAAGYPYFFAVVLDHPHPTAVGRLSYGAALLVVVGAGARQRRVPVRPPGRSAAARPLRSP